MSRGVFSVLTLTIVGFTFISSPRAENLSNANLNCGDINLERLHATKSFDVSPESAYSAAIMPTIYTGSIRSAYEALSNHNLKVAFIGDSITEGGDVPLSFSWAAKTASILSELGVENHNYALGQRSISFLLKKDYYGSLNEPEDWSRSFGPRSIKDRTWVRANVSWFEHLKQSRSNLIFIAFGVNEAFGAKPSVEFTKNLNKLISKLVDLPEKPSIVLVTSEIPSRESKGGHLPIPSNGIDEIAEATRAIAKSRRLNLVDINRIWHILLDGIDPVSCVKTVATKNEMELLGTWPGKYDGDGNGFNHPSRLGHQLTYFAGVKKFLDVLLLMQNTNI